MAKKKEKTVKKERDYKNSIIGMILVFIFCFLSGFLVSKILFGKSDKSPADGKILLSEQYCDGRDSEECIILLSNNTYKFKAKNIEGKYKKDNNILVLEKSINIYGRKVSKIEKKDGYIVFVDDNKESSKAFISKESGSLIYDKMETKYLEYLKEHYASQTLKATNYIINKVSQCYVHDKKDNSLICGITFASMFDNYNKTDCEKSEKYIAYITSTGTCEERYTTNWSFVEFNISDNYKIVGTFTGI